MRVRLSIAAVVLGAAAAGACGKLWSSRCVDDECLFTSDEWSTVKSLANVSEGPPPIDESNQALASLLADGGWTAVPDAGTPEMEPPLLRLGWLLYHDGRLSGDVGITGGSAGGVAYAKDNLGRRASPPAPRASGQPACGNQLGISCATCHDPVHYGADVTSQPNNVSNGAGWYDVNGQQTLNVARYFPVFYWNGRSDSLWSQAAQVIESGVSMNGHRLKTFRVFCRYYAASYGSVFLDQPKCALGTDDDAKVNTLTDDSPTAAYVDTFKMLSGSGKAAVSRVHVNVGKAIAAYETFLTSDGSRFDRFVHEGPNSPALEPAERRGLKLFIGHAGCVNCHNTAMLSDGKFHNIGVPQAGDHVPTLAACVGGDAAPSCNCAVPTTDAATSDDAGARDSAGGVPGDKPAFAASCLPVGAFSGWEKLHAPAAATAPPTTTLFRRCTCFADDYASGNPDCAAQFAAGGNSADMPGGCDDGARAGVQPDGGVVKSPASRDDWKRGAWRTPSLRDVAMTGPYMHDGIFATLADVVWHYDQAPAVQAAETGTSEIAPLNLTDQDRSDLVAFLGTLTGTPGPKVLIDPPDVTQFVTSCADAGATGSGDAGTNADKGSP
ncbi:MAG TPA: cytochrome c peroxidase [Polyangia bacterium]|nr:cytochrome c peroxidase [Polyangia bacterium]